MTGSGQARRPRDKGTEILLTGAAGRVGRLLRPRLAARGWAVRSFDLEPAPPGEETDWVRGDITDPEALDAAMTDICAVVHLAGIAREADFPDTLHHNIDGTYHVFEAARRAGVPRVLFASTSHVIGFHEQTSATQAGPRPDTLYGVSKVFGEALGSLYADRHGMQVACIRIGSCFPEPTNVLSLATWLSPDDAGRLFNALLRAPDLRYETLYGISANTRAWWDLAPARRLGYQPQDNAEDFVDAVVAAHGPLEPAHPDARYVGGRFTLWPTPGDLQATAPPR
ncbi:NAD-dependent epimerase/dehydratase family protein [Streptomyces sp. YGL11-2]|uniref:NAD-dependent epimerase/dehydratase family protein n=1 Tax=Streptomyces sp. YGL11-2 TaxID=3414028 RepID=UPI003CF1789F